MTELSVVQRSNPFGVAEVHAPTGGDAVATSHAREQHELQAMFTVAQAVGRNERVAWDRVMVACERPSFADGALYAFPRGGQQITGPSVQMAREIMRAWTGIVVDSPRVVEITGDEIHIRAVAIDLVSCNRTAMEDRFKKLVQRKGGWVVPDERDLRELINRRAAVLERNCILKLIPSDVVDAAIDRVRSTMVSAAQGDLETKRADVVRNLVAAFGTIGVTREMLGTKIVRALDSITGTQLSDLRSIYKGIADGHTTPADHFDVASSKAEKAADLNDRLAAKSGQKTPPKKAAKAPEDPADAIRTACIQMVDALPGNRDDYVTALNACTTPDELTQYQAMLSSELDAQIAKAEE
jgi:hypothetical protein